MLKYIENEKRILAEGLRAHVGTNFYIKEVFDKPLKIPISLDIEDPLIHIGKRSHAGRYCWDCMITLCKEGSEMVHFNTSHWYAKCPQCGKDDSEMSGKNRSVSCCSFSWAQEPEEFRRKMAKYLYSKKWIAIDEVNKKYTFRQFMEEVNNCPIQFTNNVGEYFS